MGKIETNAARALSLEELSQVTGGGGGLMHFIRAITIPGSAAPDGGTVQYRWMQPSTKQVATKETYVAEFKPWGWVVCTGAYVDELKAAAAERAMIYVPICVAGALFLWFVMRSMTHSITHRLRRMRDIADAIAHGDISQDVQWRVNDEIGEVMAALKAKYRGAEVTEGTIDVRGVVRDGLLTGAAELKSPLFSAAGDLDPVPVKKGQPLNPLQPVNRLGNVSANQEWVVHESNPLGEALGALLYKKLAERGLRLKEQQEKESVVARVGGAPQNLSWQTEEVPCWVIEYRRKEPFARTWVRASDGKVLRQEAFEGGESLVFERED